jgi:hypothetical protein
MTPEATGKFEYTIVPKPAGLALGPGPAVTVTVHTRVTCHWHRDCQLALASGRLGSGACEAAAQVLAECYY